MNNKILGILSKEKRKIIKNITISESNRPALSISIIRNIRIPINITSLINEGIRHIYNLQTLLQ